MRWRTPPEPVTVTRRGHNEWTVHWRDIFYTVDVGFTFDPEFIVRTPALLVIDHAAVADKMIHNTKTRVTKRDRAHLVARLNKHLPHIITVGRAS